MANISHLLEHNVPSDSDFSTATMLYDLPKNIADEYDCINDNCVNCDLNLGPRFIYCNQCNINICVACFTTGAEFSEHKNDHDYKIFHTNFVLFENSDWTAQEELKLLDAISTYGNWNLVAQDLPNRSVSEIMEHYDYFYLDQNGSKMIPTFPRSDAALFPEFVVPYRFKLTNVDDPPRYSTSSYHNFAGYNAARSDFENEYDANAEDLVANLELPDETDPFYNVITKMQCYLVEKYNRRLQERQRWKNVIRNHGLLVLRKTVSWLNRYNLTITRPVYEKLIRFMQFCDPTSFELLMEGLHRAGELKIQISRLIQLRRKGITTLSEGRLYLRLQQLHEEHKKKLKLFRTNSQFNIKLIKHSSLPILPKFFKRRQGFAPIDIVGLPGFEKLTDKERDLCSTNRLIPISYLELKDALIAENNKVGYVKLQTARRLLKIDVNKTRKLYDFLVAEGFILKPKN